MRRSPQWARPWSTRGSCTWACFTPRRTTRLPRFSKGRARRGSFAGSPCVKSAFLNQLCRYGYVTNSKVKFVMVVDSSNTALRDNEIRSMFRKLHNSYTDVMCNPFYNPGDRIQSRAFDNMVTSMMIQVC
ncbi:PREDICTED: trafficking protein particle complex subunit 2-like protein isoform X8 [Rhinopithecus bieti]|uniref:trafficking protein particle complex subunit 2-like protein isoform X8 n=1 Tax=Rhinopithecus bieti TaxID=61621 RepID=UPI00083BF875|nr:PREDICTED: trafficking protein particle complex subunit 2-like protein isoform X8 [Rhinopithecus bieti]